MTLATATTMPVLVLLRVSAVWLLVYYHARTRIGSGQTFWLQPDRYLVAANGSTIRTFGTRTCSLFIGVQRFEWDFFLADISQPILGADFLLHYSLPVDFKSQRLNDSASFASVLTVPSSKCAPHLAAISTTNNDFHRLLDSYPELTTPTFSALSHKHGIVHHIETRGPPVHVRAHCLPPDKLAAAKAEFAAMEAIGVVRRSNSPWTSPLHA